MSQIPAVGVTAEVHVRFLRELHAGDPVRVTFQLLDYDAKRLHYFEQLFHAEEGWVSATSENLSLHVDMSASKTIAFPREVASRLAEMKSAHERLPLHIHTALLEAVVVIVRAN